MNFGDLTIKFDEDQLKRFEAAAASVPDSMLEQPTALGVTSVTIVVPIGKVPGNRVPPESNAGIDLTARQALAVERIVRGHSPCAMVPDYPGVFRWLLDQIADQMEKA